MRPRHPPQLPHPVGGDVSVAVSRLNEPVAGVQGAAAALGHAQPLAKVVGEPECEKKESKKKRNKLKTYGKNDIAKIFCLISTFRDFTT